MSILGNTDHIKKIHLFDVLCGEGRYADNAEGSALQGLRTIFAYQQANPASKLRFSIRLNDSGQSTVEPNVKKIERVKKYAVNIPLNAAKTAICYSDLDYHAILQEANVTCNSLKSDEKALLFVDPWGYKSLQPQKLKELLACGHSELLLFLPVAHMYRFANASITIPFEGEVLTGMEPLKALLEELFDKRVPRFNSFESFADALHAKLKNALGDKHTAKFILESPGYNKYALLFFTSNLKGLEVFVQACWKIDTENGKGHFNKKSNTYPLFTPVVEHTREILDLITSKGEVTNHELYAFGLSRTMLTKTTGEALNTLRERNQIIVAAVDGKAEPRKSANFLGYKHERTVQFKLAT